MTRSLPSEAIDAHVHSGSASADGETLSDVMAGGPLKRAVLVASEANAAASENALRSAAESPVVAVSTVWTDLTAADVGDALDKLTESAKVRGIAVCAAAEQENHWLVRDDVLNGMKAAAQRGLVVDVEIEPRQIPSVGRLAELVPELKIVVAHLGSPFIARGEREPWGVYMLNAAPHQNLFVKLSGLVTLDTAPWSVAHHRLFVGSLVRLFGYERLMFGSDWPAHLSRASYGEVIDAAFDAAGPMTSRQAEHLFRDTAAAFYQIS